MPDIDHYDNLVLGSGEAGKYLAWTLAAAGHRTAVIERKLIGGSCPNIACLPSKNIIHSAKVNIRYRVARMPMAAVLRTRTTSEPRGFMKMLIDEASDRILGFTVFGAEASEPMAVVQTAMLGGLPYTALRDALFTHPTAAEGVTLLLQNVTSEVSM